MLAALLVAMLAAEAGQETAPRAPTLAEGLRAYEALDFRRARQILKTVLTAESLAADERTTALAFLARSLAVLGKNKAAQQRFLQLLELKPEFEISWEESPRIREVFAAARSAYAAGQRSEAGAGSAVGGPAPSESKGTTRSSGGRTATRRKAKQVSSRATKAAAAARRGGRPPSLPEEVTLEPLPPDEEGISQTQWIIIGGVAAAFATLITIVAVNNSGGIPEHLPRRWQLP